MKMNVGHLPAVHFGLGQGNFFIDFFYFAAGLLTDRKGIHHGKDVGQTVMMVAVPVAVMLVMVVFVMIRFALVLLPAVEDDPEVRAAYAVTEEFLGGKGDAGDSQSVQLLQNSRTVRKQFQLRRRIHLCAQRSRLAPAYQCCRHGDRNRLRVRTGGRYCGLPR